MVMVLEQSLVEEIGRIGKLRSPSEACGVILPFPWRRQQVWEVPNRSKTPHDSFEMQGDDLQILLEDFLEEHSDRETWSQIVAWHTHPKGNIGPSRYDLHNKPANIRSLVVTLREKEPPLATWY